MYGINHDRPGSMGTRARLTVAAIAAVLGTAALSQLGATAAAAQDRVGIYFDPGYTTNETVTPATPAILTGYLVLRDPSAAGGVGGWELCADIQGPAQFMSWQLEGQTINTDPPPCFTVGIGGPPLPAAPAMLLATFQLVVEAAEPVMLLLEPQFHPSLPGSMAYLDGADPDVLIPMTTVTGTPAVAFINSDVPVPDITPQFLHFGEVVLGTQETLYVFAHNAGGGVLHLDVTLPDSCRGFALSGVSGPLAVAAGQTVAIPVSFTPPDTLLHECVLSLGPGVRALFMSGKGRAPITSYSLTPTSVLFSDMAVGGTATAEISLVNLGEASLTLAPFLQDPDPGWAILSGGEPGTLALLQGRTLTVAFVASTLGSFAATLVIGPQVAQVPLLAQVGDPILDCDVSPSFLDLGTVPLGQDLAADILVQNTGNFRLVIAPTTSACYLYDIDTTAFILDPGEQRPIPVIFHADAVGQWTCSVNLGQSVCGGVFLTATVYPNPDETAQFAGVYFDQGYQLDRASTSTLDESLTGYLVLKNASNTSGVGGWECCLDLAGDGWFLDWQLEGQHLNFLDPPCFLVGIGGAPLPYSPAILLATFTMGVLTPYSEVTVLLGPTPEPSLPGSSAWIPWEDPDLLLPMQRSPGGFLPVAVVNSQVLGIQAPTPRAEVSGGGVTLRWELAGGVEDGCHVYRRIPGQDPLRLTASPLAPLGAAFTFTDPAADLAPGGVLYYSYAIVRGGAERGRSPEVMVTLGDVPGSPTGLTRLLPNVPNPFNPQTEVRFELAKAGHVRIAVYDVSGRRVAVLVDEDLGPGPQSRTWQGRDDMGRPLPSGAYYLRLETDGRLDHRKVLLLR